MTAPEPTPTAEHIDAVTLDLDAIEADALAALNPSRCRCTVQSGSVYSSQCPRHDPRDPGYRAPWQMPPATALALVAEVRRLTAEAATQREWFEAADAAAERRLDQSIAWMERAEAAESELVTLRARLAAVQALAEKRDVLYPPKWAFGAEENYCNGYRQARADFIAAMATGEGQ